MNGVEVSDDSMNSEAIFMALIIAYLGRTLEKSKAGFLGRRRQKRFLEFAREDAAPRPQNQETAGFSQLGTIPFGPFSKNRGKGVFSD